MVKYWNRHFYDKKLLKDFPGKKRLLSIARGKQEQRWFVKQSEMRPGVFREGEPVGAGLEDGHPIRSRLC